VSRHPRQDHLVESRTSAAAYTVGATIYESASTGVYRATRAADGRPVILKVLRRKPPRTHELERLRREHEIGSSSNARAIVRPLALETVDGAPTLVLEDVGGESLERLIDGPMDVGRFLRLAVAITSALADVHRHGIVHRDVKPGNLVVRGGDAGGVEVRLADFGIASAPGHASAAPTVWEGEAAAPAAPAVLIEGSLPYMSPEQTGRMNRGVDHRSDLYSLGVTFFEMLSGHLPFSAEDPLEWIHCHLAREAPPLARVAAHVPEPLAAIVAKLLAKRPEERYQTAAGLLHDLVTCQKALASGAVAPFELGTRDAADTFEIPHKLYGRREPSAQLAAALERVSTTGQSQLVLVSGYSGIGKSSLVFELEAPVAAQGGAFLTGKFDQVQRDVPYATIVQAFRGHVAQLLAADEVTVGRFRARLDAALGVNADLIVQMFPELERVLGPRASVTGLARSEEETRFHRTFRQFLSVLTQEEAGGRTLVLFLDDLQWAEEASLRLLTRVLAHPDTPHVLTIGAYRDNEVHPSHRLVLSIEDLRRTGARVQDVVLGPLSLGDTTALVADAVHADLETAAPLAALVHERTAGNPFFVIQFLTVLHDEGLIAPVPLRGLVWDVAQIRELGFADNVVELVTHKLARLPPPVGELLKLAACIGNTVDVGQLHVARGASRADTEALLQLAVAEGMVVRRRSSYRFLHDRVQQAAYALIPEAERAEVHLRIGRLLLSRERRRAPNDSDATPLFDIVNHLNIGAAARLVTDAGERADLAQLNLAAARRAKASTAYSSAIRYCEAGLALPEGSAWATDHALAYGLHFELAECSYLVGRFKDAEARFAEVLAHTTSTLDRAAVYVIEVDLFTSQIELDKAVDTAVRGLAELGVSLRSHPTDEEMARTAERLFGQLAGRSMDELLELPRMTDPQMRAALGILAVLFGPSHSTDPNLPFVVYANMVEISLKHGNTDASAIGYAYFGMSIGPKFGRYKDGYAFGKLGYDLAEKRGLLAYKSKLALIFGDCIGPFSRPLLLALDHLDVAFRSAVETGDLTFACYCCNHIVFDRLLLGEPLGDVFRESLRRYDFARKANFDASCRIIGDIQLFVLAMRGAGAEALREQGPFDEATFIAEMDAYPWPIIRCWHFIMRLATLYMLGDVEGALAAGFAARELIWTSMAHLQEPEFWFFFGLALAASLGPADANGAVSLDRARRLELLRAHERKLAEWSTECPENFETKWALVAAELARVEGRAEDAMALYEQAIRAGRASGFVQNEGLALELASAFYRARGFELIADTYGRDARAAYVRWGAFGKVAELDRRWPHLAAAEAPAATDPAGMRGTLALRAEWLDLGSLVKASQSISSEVSLERVVSALFRIVIEQGAAQRGFLVLTRGGEPFIEAEAWLDDAGVQARILPPTPLAGAKVLPTSLVRAVLQSGRRVLLDDATRQNAFSGDEYIVRAAPRSALGLPIVRRTEVVGLLYLENNALPGAFTAERLAALELVMSQAAISLEIAKLVETERAARASAEAAERRAAFLSDATALLVESLDYEAQLTRLARLAVEWFAEMCLIDLVEGDRIRRVAATHRTPAGEAMVAELSARFPTRFDSSSPQARVLRSHEPLLWPDMTRDKIAEHTTSPEHERLVTAIGLRTLICLPLMMGGKPAGIITIGGAGRPYDERDLALARELADRASIAIGNARLYREAQDAVHVRDEFLSIASHELRTPLTSLLLSLQTLERRPWAGRPLAPLIDARRIGQASRQAERLDRLIGDLLDVSRLESGQLVLSRAAVNLGELAREVVSRFEEDASRSGCVVTVETTGTVVGSWDGSRLDQVLTNLLANSIKFGAGKPILVRVDQHDGRALLVVKDQGIGIAPDRIGRIFERFERAVPTEHFGGLGLGLYVCKRFVDAHRGTIGVASELGVGSTFSVELPLE
jgi:predicted ATPase/GAF domain-containing protein/tRNA A-37 threonylcarbamoyl transferase component Bud32